MKIIDLLNKIANGEEIPKEIEYTRKHYYLTNNQDIDNFGSDIGMFNLNDEIEIIEDTPKEEKKIPKKIKVVKDNSNDIVSMIYDDTKYDITILQAILIDNINAIIDYLESKGK